MPPLTCMPVASSSSKPSPFFICLILKQPSRNHWFRVFFELILLNYQAQVRKEGSSRSCGEQWKETQSWSKLLAFRSFLPQLVSLPSMLGKKLSPKIKRRWRRGVHWKVQWRCALPWLLQNSLNSGNSIPKHEHHKKRKAGPRSQCFAGIADRSSHGGTGDVGSNPRSSFYSLFDF